jgi:hypothetical protein
MRNLLQLLFQVSLVACPFVTSEQECDQKQEARYVSFTSQGSIEDQSTPI